MIKAISIVILTIIAILLVRYRTDRKLQKIVVMSVLLSFFVYTLSIVVIELFR